MHVSPFEKKSLQSWQQSHPLVTAIAAAADVFWFNQQYQPFANSELPLTRADIDDASARLSRFAPYIAKVFPETAAHNGIIESTLRPITHLQRALALESGETLPGTLLLKCDSHLPISGSVKARGGIYEVLKQAEQIAIASGLLTRTDNYQKLTSVACKALFSKHSISVGSTGNLGLSIGIMSAKLGFKVTVHMSADASRWKKQLLRSKNVTVIEYDDDYSKAVEQGRTQALQTKNCHFVDDENSQDLFLGYAVAALRLKQQLAEQKIQIDAQHPLFVYLPCGVGGAPGGIAFGLKQVFNDHVHCFFAEPSASPCMLLGMYTGLHDGVAVQDFGLDGVTCADGLAVARPSAFVGRFMQPILSGIYTLSDREMYRLLALIKDTEELALEPSAMAGLIGMQQLNKSGKEYLKAHNLTSVMSNSTHIAWATGGSMLPDKERQGYYDIGKKILAEEH